MAEFLDLNGVAYVWDKVKQLFQYAGPSQDGIVSDTDQVFGGQKGLYRPIIYGTSNNPAIWFKTSDSAGDVARVIAVLSNNAYLSNIRFVQYSNDGTNRISHYEQYNLPIVQANLSTNPSYDILTTKDSVTVAQGGTGATSLSSGYALIGNGTNAVTSREIINNTAAGDLGWDNKTNAIRLVTQNTIAYWNGEYKSGSSNLSHLSTITSGTWEASPIAIAYGGTGASSASDALSALGGLPFDSTVATTGANLDNFTTTGVYIYNSNVTNIPTAAGGLLLVMRYSSTYCNQLAFCNSLSANITPIVYVRLKNGNGWGSWNKVAYET